MAFFDFDRTVQTILIAGALASVALAPACGGKHGGDGVDSGPDITDPIMSDDPATDMLEITDPIMSDDPATDMLEITDVVDPAPDAIDAPDGDAPEDGDLDGDETEDADEEDAIEAFLPHGFLKTLRSSTPLGDGRMELEVSVRGGGRPSVTWTASSGLLDASGTTAVWTPPSRPGIHSVQATVTSGNHISIETFKLKV